MSLSFLATFAILGAGAYYVYNHANTIESSHKYEKMTVRPPATNPHVGELPDGQHIPFDAISNSPPHRTFHTMPHNDFNFTQDRPRL